MSVPRWKYTRQRFFFTMKVLSNTDLDEARWSSAGPPEMSCIILEPLHRRRQEGEFSGVNAATMSSRGQSLIDDTTMMMMTSGRSTLIKFPAIDHTLMPHTTPRSCPVGRASETDDREPRNPTKPNGRDVKTWVRTRVRRRAALRYACTCNKFALRRLSCLLL